jgi:hypothetical protein
MKYVTDPRQAREVKMRDGTTYPVGAGGSFVITKSEHLDEMDRGDHDYYTAATYTAAKGRDCPCGRVAWGWSDTCARCGQSLRDAT